MAQAGTSSPDARDEIVDVLRRYEAAFNENDAAGMNSLFTSDATFVNFGGNIVFGAADLLRAQEFVFNPGGPLEDVKVRYTLDEDCLHGVPVPDGGLALAEGALAGVQ